MTKSNKLHTELCSTRLLHDAWRKLNKSNRQSHGLSDETIDVFDHNLNDRISQISTLLKTNSYGFSNTRAAIFPKGGKTGFRPLQIPEIKDRVVLKALALIIERQFRSILKPCKIVSFAYQKNLSIKDATLAIREKIDQGNLFVLEVDLVDFFGKIDKDILINKMILPQLSDNSIDEIIKESLNQKISGLDKIRKPYKNLFENISSGIPQGNPLSPLFSNIYLNPFDKRMIKEQINLIRYADDFVILAKTKELAESALEICIEELENNLKLEIHKSGKKKYKITNLNNSTFDFLSIEHGKNTYRPTIRCVDEILKNIRKECRAGTIKKDLQYVLFKTKWMLDGWVSAFYFADLSSHSLKIDLTINKSLYTAFTRLGFVFNKKHLDILPYQFRNNMSNNFCISKKQRQNTGIKLVETIWIAKKNSASKVEKSKPIKIKKKS